MSSVQFKHVLSGVFDVCMCLPIFFRDFSAIIKPHTSNFSIVLGVEHCLDILY